jgi:hypothetical protein
VLSRSCKISSCVVTKTLLFPIPSTLTIWQYVSTAAATLSLLQVMDSHAYVKSIPTERTYPMRMQSDVDISNGYMHSGYPFMAYMDVVNSTLNVSIAR